jgi:predicted ATPase
MLLNQVHIRAFRSIDHVELALTPVTVIVGKNDSGKTNLLSAIRFAQSYAAGEVGMLAQDGVIMRGANADMMLGLSFELPVPQLGLERAALEYDARFRPSATGTSMVAEKLRLDGETWFEFGDGRWKALPGADVPRRKQKGSCLGLFKRDPIVRAVRKFFLRGFSAYSLADEWASDHPSSSGNYLEALAGLIEHAPARAMPVVKIAQLLIPNLMGMDVGKFDGRLVPTLLFSDRRPERLDRARLSAGVHHLVRLITLMHQQPGTVVLLDEPEAHLHPKLQIELARQFRTWADGRLGQLIITSHSPHLFEHISSESIRVIRREVGETILEPIEARGTTSVANALADETTAHPKPIVASGKAAAPYNEHSPDFTSVRWHGENYIFNLGQESHVIRVLWAEWERGNLGMHESTIGEQIGSDNRRFRLVHVFRHNPSWKSIIESLGRGRYRLAPAVTTSPTSPFVARSSDAANHR